NAWGFAAQPSGCPHGWRRSRRCFAGSFRFKAAVPALQHTTLALARHTRPELAGSSLEHGMAPAGGNIHERPQHERPLMGERMRQDERPETGGGESPSSVSPMSDEPLIVDEVDVERAWTPRPAAPPAGVALDPLQHSEQRFGGESRLEERDGIPIGRLPCSAHCACFIERRNRAHGAIRLFDSAQSVSNRLRRRPPGPGTICTKSYQDFATEPQLRSHAVTPMLLMQP